MKTEEEAGRFIVKLLVERFGAKPGQVLLPHFFSAEFSVAPCTPADFQNGCGFAVSRGWIELNQFGSLKLMNKGLEALGSS